MLHLYSFEVRNHIEVVVKKLSTIVINTLSFTIQSSGEV